MTTTENNVYVEKEEDSINISELLHLFLYKWYWFLLSFLIISGIAIIYLLTTPNVYSCSASLLIKENLNSQSAIAGEIGESFSNIGMSVTKKNVNNELHTLLSPSLMMEVVKRLHLNFDYHVQEGLYKKTIYGSSLPVTVSFKNSTEVPYQSFTINILKNGRIELFDFESDNEETGNGDVLKGQLGCTINSPLGEITVTPAIYYKKDSLLLVSAKNQ